MALSAAIMRNIIMAGFALFYLCSAVCCQQSLCADASLLACICFCAAFVATICTTDDDVWRGHSTAAGHLQSASRARRLVGAYFRRHQWAANGVTAAAWCVGEATASMARKGGAARNVSALAPGSARNISREQATHQHRGAALAKQQTRMVAALARHVSVASACLAYYRISPRMNDG